MGVGSQRHAPAAFTPGKDPVSIVQEAGWAAEPVWIGAENLAPPGFDPRTVQLVGSRYTDWDTQPISNPKVISKNEREIGYVTLCYVFCFLSSSIYEYLK